MFAFVDWQLRFAFNSVQLEKPRSSQCLVVFKFWFVFWFPGSENVLTAWTPNYLDKHTSLMASLCSRRLTLAGSPLCVRQQGRSPASGFSLSPSLTDGSNLPTRWSVIVAQKRYLQRHRVPVEALREAYTRAKETSHSYTGMIVSGLRWLKLVMTNWLNKSFLYAMVRWWVLRGDRRFFLIGGDSGSLWCGDGCWGVKGGFFQ